MKTRISPLRTAEWNDPNRSHPFKVDSFQYRPFDFAIKTETKSHPFSIDASLEGN